jgi:DHA3 family tetracycline resistance protein-like MFS transporter
VLVEAREGIRFTFSLTWLWVTVFGFALINAAFTIPWVGLPILIRDVLRGNALTLGSITAAFAVGEVSGTILLARFRIVRAGTWMYLFAALMGGGLIGMGVAPSLVLTLAAVVGIGIGFVGFGVLWDSVLQRYVPRELLGRVASVDGFGALLLAPVSPVAGGILVELLGAPPVFVAGGAFAILLCLSALVVPSIRRLSLPDQADASVTS